MKRKARVIAFYLPQFHPIPENDENWGKGFTEWVNVASAKPLWRGHHQPRIPADLGFYDIRLPEIREEQAKLAKEAGVESFMYWHYWFGDGKMLLEKPAEWLLETQKPDFPFCFGWANHEWSTKTWHKGNSSQKTRMIAEMRYLGTEDNRKHFDYCLPFFKDYRYTTIESKPVFLIFSPETFVGLSQFIAEWNIMAKEAGLNGIYFIGMNRAKGQTYESIKKLGVDGVCNSNRFEAEEKATGGKFIHNIKGWLANKLNLPANKLSYEKIVKYNVCADNGKEDCFPTVIPGYDHTARRGSKALIYTNPTPMAFQKSIEIALSYVKHKDFDHKVIFLNSWNEWGEGNYMEPDTKWKHAYLDALRHEILVDS